MREFEILWLRLRDHLEDYHDFNGGRLDKLKLLELLIRHKRAHRRRRTHWHPRYSLLAPRLVVVAAANGDGACGSERPFSRPAIESDAAASLEPVLS